MNDLLQPFITRPLVKQTQDETQICYFDEEDEPVADVYLNEAQTTWSSIVFHHEALDEQPPISEEALQPFVQAAERVFINERYQFDQIERFDDFYIAFYNYYEPRYKLHVPAAGLTLMFDFAGRLQEVVRGEAEIILNYPQQLITKDEARAILATHQIVKKNIIPEAKWRYGYSLNHYFMGILPDGDIQHIHDLPEMDGADFTPLPDVEPTPDFEAFLRGGRRAIIEDDDDNGIRFWRIDVEDIDISLPEPGFIRACRLLKSLVGEHYAFYHLEQIPEAMQANSDTLTTYRFIYVLADEDIAFQFFPIVIEVDEQTNQILYVEAHPLPYDKIAAAAQPTVSLGEANAIALQHADVRLTVVPNFDHVFHYSFMYILDFPQSPTGGPLYYVDGASGQVVFVKSED